MSDRGVFGVAAALLILVVAGGVGGHLVGLDLSSNLALLSILISVVTLIALYAQNRHLQAQVQSMQAQTGISVSEAAYSKAFEMQQIFIEHGDLWPYFHHGKEVETGCPAEKVAQLEAVALLKLDYFSLVEDVYRCGDVDASDRLSSRSYLLHGIRQSPVLRNVFARHAEWYPKLRPYFDEIAAASGRTSG